MGNAMVPNSTSTLYGAIVVQDHLVSLQYTQHSAHSNHHRAATQLH
jgi:hypothetical protein